MKFVNKNANDLLSKDFNLSARAAQSVINFKDVKTFEELVQNEDFIFDFLKDKIVKNLIRAVNQNNVQNCFEFMKIYSYSFSDAVISPLVKFANEDVTDIMLEKFEHGTDSEKAYAALYFARILDPLALPVAKSHLEADFEPLKINCIKLLFAHGERTEYDNAILKLNSSDPDILYSGVDFLINYGDIMALTEILESLSNSPYGVDFSADLLYLADFKTISAKFDFKYFNLLLSNLLDGIPDYIVMSEFLADEIFSALNILKNNEISLEGAINFLKAKNKFKIYDENEAYLLDLDKNTKQKISEISNFFKTFDGAFYGELFDILAENFSDNEFAFDILEIFEQENLSNFAELIIQSMPSFTSTPLICKSCEVLKNFGKLSSLNPSDTVVLVQSEQARALIQSYFS